MLVYCSFLFVLILYARPVGWWDDLIPVISLIVVIGQETNFFFCEVPIGFLTTSVCVCVYMHCVGLDECFCVCAYACKCVCVWFVCVNTFLLLLFKRES